MKRTRLIYLIFLAAVILVAGSMIVTYQIGLVVLKAERRMSVQLTILNQLADLESTVKDAETSQRGFLLTGEELYMEPFRRA